MDWNKLYNGFEAESKPAQPQQLMSPEAQAVNQRIEQAIKSGMDTSEVDKIANRIYSEDIDEEDPIYPNFESAQAALDRGERVRIAMEPFAIDPQLIQLALDLQAKERFEEWKQRQQS